MDFYVSKDDGGPVTLIGQYLNHLHLAHPTDNLSLNFFTSRMPSQ